MAKKKMSTGTKIALGTGVAALGAAAYYFLGPDAKKHQAKAKMWSAKMKKQFADKVKKAEKLRKEWEGIMASANMMAGNAPMKAKSAKKSPTRKSAKKRA